MVPNALNWKCTCLSGQFYVTCIRIQLIGRKLRSHTQKRRTDKVEIDLADHKSSHAKFLPHSALFDNNSLRFDILITFFFHQWYLSTHIRIDGRTSALLHYKTEIEPQDKFLNIGPLLFAL